MSMCITALVSSFNGDERQLQGPGQCLLYRNRIVSALWQPISMGQTGGEGCARMPRARRFRLARNASARMLLSNIRKPWSIHGAPLHDFPSIPPTLRKHAEDMFPAWN